VTIVSAEFDGVSLAIAQTMSNTWNDPMMEKKTRYEKRRPEEGSTMRRVV
jgi:hypothetical protein